jgi:RNA polymerase sigma factor (sigma-70 family)
VQARLRLVGIDPLNPLGLVTRITHVLPVRARHDRLPDEALLAAVGLDEPDAAIVFVRRFQGRVFGLAFVITGDRNLAEDVAQQAFERAWRHAGSFDSRRGTVVTWLLAIVHNLAVDTARVRRPELVDPSDLLELLPPASDVDPESAAMRADDLGRLRPALDALPVEQRRAVLLATIAGRTSREIGIIEGIPTPTAKTRLRTGLAKLQAAVIREDGE